MKREIDDICKRFKIKSVKRFFEADIECLSLTYSGLEYLKKINQVGEFNQKVNINYNYLVYNLQSKRESDK
jgi:hypothetical protein